jgi:DNA/RNA endonuclease YhcR with UshA esterase domain
MRRVFLFVVGVAFATGTAAYAHHSYSATYDVTHEVKLEGKLVSFVYRNPHSFVHVQAPDEKGTQRRWAVEWSGTGQLAEAGVQRDTLKVGDGVTIVGRPSRVPGEYRVLMVSLKRPSDGFSWGGRGGLVVD